MLATPAVASTAAFLRGMPPMIWNYVLFLYLRVFSRYKVFPYYPGASRLAPRSTAEKHDAEDSGYRYPRGSYGR